MERKRRVIALALAAGMALGCQRAEPAPPRAPAAAPEDVASAGGASELRYTASIRPRQEIPLAFEVGGTVRRMALRSGADGKPRPLQPGDFVRHGTELARLAEDGFRRRVALARARRAEAAAAGSNLAAAEAELASALEELRDTVLYAPLDSIVVSRSVDVGTVAAPGTVAFVLADVSEMRATFDVPTLVARSILVGQTLELELEPGADPVAGWVMMIVPSADARAPAFSVVIGIPNPDRRIEAGTIATLRVPARGRPQGASAAQPLSAAAR